MRNRERFFEAFAHSTSHRAMGRALRPFTLRHRFWLEAFESPVVSGGTVTWIDLELATLVCSIPCDALDRRMPKLLTRGPRWSEKLRFIWWLWRGRADKEYTALLDYLCDFGCPPATHSQVAMTKDGKVYEAMPGLLSLVTAVVRGSGWPRNEVWSLSPGEAEWYLTGIYQHRGVDMKLKTEHDEEFEEGMRKEREAAEAAKQAQGPDVPDAGTDA